MRYFLRQSPSLLVSGSGSRPHYTRLTKMAMVKLRQILGNILMRQQRVPFESGDFVEQVEIGNRFLFSRSFKKI